MHKLAHTLIDSSFFVLNFMLFAYRPNFVEVVHHTKESTGLPQME